MKIPDSGFQNVLNELKENGKEKQNPTPSEKEKENISEGFKICGQHFADVIDGKGTDAPTLYELAVFHHLDQYMDEYDEDGNIILK